MSRTLARTWEPPRTATKKESPPVTRGLPFASWAMIENSATSRTVAVLKPSPDTIQYPASVDESVAASSAPVATSGNGCAANTGMLEADFADEAGRTATVGPDDSIRVQKDARLFLLWL